MHGNDALAAPEPATDAGIVAPGTADALGQQVAEIVAMTAPQLMPLANR